MRCEADNGRKKCEIIWNIMAIKKCPVGYVRYGCCACNLPCPNGMFDYFEDFSNVCKKQFGKNLDYWSTLSMCEQSSVSVQITNNRCEKTFLPISGKKKEKGKINDVWTQACQPGFEKLKKMICIKTCPQGFEK